MRCYGAKVLRSLPPSAGGFQDVSVALRVTCFWSSHDVPKRTHRIQSPPARFTAVRIHALVNSQTAFVLGFAVPRPAFNESSSRLCFTCYCFLHFKTVAGADF